MGYTTSPLRYPGGKTRLARFMMQVMRENNLAGGEYVEPYAGGAGVAWSLLFNGWVSHVYINDIDRAVSAFWVSVFEHTEELCRLIECTPVTLDQWHRQKSIEIDLANYSDLEVGFATFFLNRTNRSGILSGGIIGGKSQSGIWKMDARFNKGNLVARIMRIAAYKARVTVSAKDAVEFLQETLPGLSSQALLYLDPPYFKQGANLYLNHYKHADHDAVCEYLDSVQHKWIVTYDHEPVIDNLYAGHRRLVYSLSYSAADRYSGSEIMFFSPGLKVPRLVSPIGAKSCSPPASLLQTNMSV